MADTKQEVIAKTLEKYGATVDQYGQIFRGEKCLRLCIFIKGPRIRVESCRNDGTLLFSGPIVPSTVEKFVESYWFWKKI